MQHRYLLYIFCDFSCLLIESSLYLTLLLCNGFLSIVLDYYDYCYRYRCSVGLFCECNIQFSERRLECMRQRYSVEDSLWRTNSSILVSLLLICDMISLRLAGKNRISCYTDKSSGRSEISFSRFPCTSVSSVSNASSEPTSLTARINS